MSIKGRSKLCALHKLLPTKVLCPQHRDPIRQRAMTSCREPSPVHSAHVGQELQVHYRWHPHFGRTVIVRRVEQRATGQFLKVEGPSGIVVSIPAWIVDPLVCADMRIGQPQVDLATLLDLKRLVTRTAAPTNSPSDNGIAREEIDEAARRACADVGQADEPDVRTMQSGGNERCRAGGGHNHACPGSDAGRRPSHRGAR